MDIDLTGGGVGWGVILALGSGGALYNTINILNASGLLT